MQNKNDIFFKKNNRYSNVDGMGVANVLTLGGAGLFQTIVQTAGQAIPTSHTQTYNANTNTAGGYNTPPASTGSVPAYSAPAATNTVSASPSNKAIDYKKIGMYSGIGLGVIAIFIVLYKIAA